MTANRVGSMFTFFFTDKQVTDWDSAATCDTAKFGRFHNAMLNAGDLAATIAVRSRVPQRGPHAAAHRADDRRGARSAEAGLGQLGMSGLGGVVVL